jgi:hypothetical protein
MVAVVIDATKVERMTVIVEMAVVDVMAVTEVV